MREADLTIHAEEMFFERRWTEHKELEVEVNYEVEGETLTDLILVSDRRASELAEGRAWYVYRLLVEETSTGLTAECTAYVAVPRIQPTAEEVGQPSKETERSDLPR